MMKLKRNMVQVDKDKIDVFWSWFRKTSKALSSDTISPKLIELMNENILSLGDFDWEIREGTEKSNMLIISPGGDPKLLLATKEIIDSSPTNMEEWEFCDSKPPKNWDYQLSIKENGVKKMLNASDWEYVLLGFPDNTYDMIVRAPGMKSFGPDQQYDMLDLVLESVLGERMSLSLIKNVDIVENFSSPDNLKKGSIKNLRGHLLELQDKG